MLTKYIPWLDKHVETQKDWFIKLCQSLIQIPTPNPPGETTEAFVYIKDLFEVRDIPYQIYEPKKGCPNLVAMLGSGDSPKLTLNGHIDTFPVGEPEKWSGNPYSGIVKNGKIFGRGAADMKAGSSAALGVFLLMAEENVEFEGTVMLSLVSDEETGSEWGTWWLADNVPEMIGDACLIGEPTGVGTPLIGQKAPLWLSIKTESMAEHGAFNDGRDAIWQMAKAILALQTLNDLTYKPPREIVPLVNTLKEKAKKEGNGRGEWWLERPSVNFGRISGGLKVNIVPSSCELELDIRIPFGTTKDELLDELDQRLKKIKVAAEVEIIMGERDQPNYSSWDDPFLTLLNEVITQVHQEQPQPLLMPYFTDGRIFRQHGVVTASCGPTAYNMAAPNEYITIEDFLKVVKIFGLTTLSYCHAKI
jgi:succinyl-diaminopimelate desuccinylase